MNNTQNEEKQKKEKKGESEKNCLKIQKKLTIETKLFDQKTKPFSLVDAGGLKEEVNQTYQSNQLTTTNTNSNQGNISNSLIKKTTLARSNTGTKTSVQLIIASESPDLFLNRQSPFTLTELTLKGNNKQAINHLSFGLNEINNQDAQFDIFMKLGVNNNEHKLLFHIIYEENEKNYYLKSQTSDYFFSLIVSPYHQIILENNQKNYFKIGKIIIVISPRNKDNSLHVIIKQGELTIEKKEYTYTYNQCPVSIGRTGCTVNILCNSLSKSHATLDFDLSHRRFFFIDNASTNGSQFLLNKGKSIKLSGDQMFNINDLLFSINEVIK